MEKLQPSFVPVAIIIAGALIAGAVIFKGGNPTAAAGGGQQQAEPNYVELAKQNLRPVDASDHVRGAASAKVALIEYSDIQCPFCASFHPTIKQVLEEYAGQVKWVYRHMPLPFHPEATPAALAVECAAELGGNEAFWNMTDALLVKQSTLGTALYESTAVANKIPIAAFRTCMQEERHKARVEADLQNAAESGAQGTPYAVLVADGKDPIVIPGALPYAQVKILVEQALR